MVFQEEQLLNFFRFVFTGKNGGVEREFAEDETY
jgi:hypothetical protein